MHLNVHAHIKIMGFISLKGFIDAKKISSSHVSKSVSMGIGGWQGFLSPPSLLTEANSVGGRVTVMEVSAGPRRENYILSLNFLMLET